MTGVRMADIDGQQRAEEIERYDVLHHPPRSELVAIVELAAQICGTSMATINLITDIEQHQVAAHGFPADVCRREDSMCAAILHEKQTPIVVADASLDARFRDNPFVTGVIGNVRFYASHKLVTFQGVTIGTLCVFDEQPRHLEKHQHEALGTLAERIVDILELSLRSRQLARSNERLSDFAGRVSHDLKSPLSSVALSLGLIKEQLAAGAPGDDIARLLERAISGSERMANLIDEVLAFSAVGGRLEMQRVSLDRVVDEALADADSRLADVVVDKAPLPDVEGDPGQLRSVFQNLLDNASKYRHPERPLRIEISAEVRETRWVVCLADNGVGIPAAERERVFEARVRLEATESIARGMGIGLSTCQRVIQAHGGRIGIDETPGGGTTVWFTLPA
ncbi:MAG: ATP-binding protein [Nocardioides sp.]|uniref:sensor histidine kinase n=1 Tax=Nocardioides sp. TaxID=35761 RepID=UPI00238D9147|nr:ATP-binding protein [Nocardioides sp.]MDE0776082.1 ATP-binding protein [Nocardioides sp.]